MASGPLLRIAAAATVCVIAACGDGAPGVSCLPSSEKPIAQVERCPVSASSFRFTYSMLGGVGGGDTRRHAAVNALIARELLAQGAQEAGDRPLGRGEVEKRIAKGELYFMGRVPAEGVYREGRFEHDAFVQLADRAGVSVNALVAEQGREMLAQKMRDRLGAPDQVNAWLTERCKRAQAAGRLSIMPEVLERFGDDGKPLPAIEISCDAWGTLL